MTTWFDIRRICPAAGFVLFLLTSFGYAAAAAAEPKRVMLLHSFGRDFKPWSEYAKSIRAELDRQSPWRLDITDHSLVSARSSDEDPEAPFVEYLRALFAKQPLDLIVSIGAPAAAFVQRHRQRLFTNTPMVFTAVEQRRVQYSTLTPNDAVVAVWINYFAAIENILRVLPDTKNVIVVVGTSPIEKFWKEAIGRESEPLSKRIRFSWTDHLSFEELLKQAATLPPQSAIFWELMIIDAAGVVHEGGAPLTRLHAVANAPIFSYDESFFGREIVGGPLLLAADTADKRPPLPFAYSAERSRATSKCPLSSLRGQCSTGGKCSAGALAKVGCLQAARFFSANRPPGNDIGRKFWQSAPFFWRRSR